MRTPSNDWENLLLLAGSPDRVLLISFKNPKLKPLTGKTLAEVAKMRGKSPEETAMDLVIEDDSRVGTVYFLMSEDNIRREVALPWMGFGSDEASEAPEGVFLKSSSHPRAYGNVARFLGKYVRDEKAASLADAIRRLTSLPATNLGIRKRGWLEARLLRRRRRVRSGHGSRTMRPSTSPSSSRPASTTCSSTASRSWRDGEHTGAKPGRFVRGPGWTGWPGGGACRADGDSPSPGTVPRRWPERLASNRARR